MSSQKTLPMSSWPARLAPLSSIGTMLGSGGFVEVVTRTTRALRRWVLRALFETTSQGFSPWSRSHQ